MILSKEQTVWLDFLSDPLPNPYFLFLHDVLQEALWVMRGEMRRHETVLSKWRHVNSTWTGPFAMPGGAYFSTKKAFVDWMIDNGAAASMTEQGK